MGSLSFLFRDKFKENANIPVAIKSDSAILSLTCFDLDPPIPSIITMYESVSGVTNSLTGRPLMLSSVTQQLLKRIMSRQLQSVG